NRVPRPKFEAEKILECSRQTRAPTLNGNLCEVSSINKYSPLIRLVQPCKEFYESGLAGAVFADDRDYRSALQVQVYIFEDATLRAGIRERYIFQTYTFGEPLRRRNLRVFGLLGSIVLQPRQAAGTIEPDAAQESDFTDRGADIRREP